jgi:heterodisulfide reductase subunit A-like polyferredoxin
MLNTPYDIRFLHRGPSEAAARREPTKGIFIAGACTFPGDIPDSVMMAPSRRSQDLFALQRGRAHPGAEARGRGRQK